MIYLAAALWLAGVALLWHLGQRGAAPSAIRSFERPLPLSRLPAALDGLRLLHISDAHLSPRNDFTESIVSRAEAARPDLVAVTGDLPSGPYGIPLARRLLERLAARWPTYVVLGNADHRADRFHHSIARWHETGAHVLINRGIPSADGRLWIAGVDDPMRHRDDPAQALANAPANAFRLLLAHSPDVIQRAAALEADLILSGHTHGGQVRLPLIGALLTRARVGRRYARGVFRLGSGAVLIVTSGLGVTRLAVRFWCPPEMTLWVMRRSGQTAVSSKQ